MSSGPGDDPLHSESVSSSSSSVSGPLKGQKDGIIMDTPIVAEQSYVTARSHYIFAR
jgi:hypothetical protein